MIAEIVTIGDELLIGQVVNTNQAYIAAQLSLAGVGIRMMTTVGDDADAILKSFHDAWDRADIIIVTGGLGPTHDDITKKVVCTFFHTDLELDPAVREHIVRLFGARGMPWTTAAAEQAMVPKAASVLHNPLGTAPGLLFERDGKCFFVLPGVPYEMKAIVDESIIPFVRRRQGSVTVRHRTLRTTGVGESVLAHRIGPVEHFLGDAKLAFLPSPTGVRLRITLEDGNEARATGEIQRIEMFLREKIGKHVYGVEDEEIEDVLGELLTSRRLTLAVAESCTGGLITDRLTNVSGSSAYVERGVVTYSNKSKTTLLDVPADLIARHGAVSKEVAEAMAAGARTMASTDIGIATTGIAGPTGGTEEKPVGLVWIGYSDRNETIALRFQYGGLRRLIKERAAQAALELLRRKLLKLG
jgi:nicotinamide-nucleotide amidase